MNKELLGKNIVYLRKKNKMTQEALAESIGMTRKQLSNYENGKVKRESNDVIWFVAKFFHVRRNLIDTVDLESIETMGGDIYDNSK